MLAYHLSTLAMSLLGPISWYYLDQLRASTRNGMVSAVGRVTSRVWTGTRPRSFLTHENTSIVPPGSEEFRVVHTNFWRTWYTRKERRTCSLSSEFDDEFTV